jgi:DNA repair protein SbcD/Mre11
MTIRFVHTGDLHLDTPFKGLTRSNQALAAQLKEASLRSFRKIIDLCILEKVDFLLVAGDIFDSELKSLSAQLRFVDELKRLGESDIPAYIIAGNHDPLNSWMKELSMPGNVHRFGPEPGFYVYEKDGKPMADICGVSFERKEETANLAVKFSTRPGMAPFSIALLHGTVGAATGHNPYAPFTLEDIRGKGFDYWALGHVHKRQILQRSNPAVVYAGNPQGRDFGENGERGCFLVELKENAEPDIRFVPTHFIRFEEVRIDLTGQSDLSALSEELTRPLRKILSEDTSGFIFRLRLEGYTSLHKILSLPDGKEELLSMMNEDLAQQQQFYLVDDIIVGTRPESDPETLRSGNDFTAEIFNRFDNLQKDNEAFNQLMEMISSEVNSADVLRELTSLTAEEKQEVLENARWLLLDQLIKEQL